MKNYLILILALFSFCELFPNPIEDSTLIHTKAKAYQSYKDGEYDDARKSFQQLIDHYPNNLELVALCYNNLGAIDKIEGFNSRAIKYCQKALNTYEKLGRDTLTAKCLYNNGLVYKSLGQYEKATADLLRAVKIFEAYDLLEDLSKSYNVLANLFSTSNSFELALEYHSKAIENSQELSDSVLLAKYLNNRGKTYFEMEFFEEAVQDYKFSLLIKQSIPLLKSSAYTLYNLGELEFIRNRIPEAEAYFLNSKKIHEQFKNETELAHCLNYLGRIYTAQGNWTKAVDYLNRALEYAQKYNMHQLKLENYQFQTELYEQIDQAKKALGFNKQYVELYKLILNEEKQKAIDELQIKYEVEKMERENKALFQETQENALTMNEQKLSIDNWQRTALGGAILILFVLFLGFRYYQLSKKESMLAAKEKRMNLEQHHRIKNHLQALAGLLSLQQKGIEDIGAKEVIQESKNRVTVITLLHQHLYESDDLSSSHIQLDSYLKELVDNLAFLFKRPNVAIELELEKISIDSNKALPLGLICNEIINNAFKYGLHKKKAILVIHLSQKEESIELRIHDNGDGFVETNSNSSVGQTLIPQLAKQIDAQLTKDTTQGSSYRLIFKT
ncbi:MAG: tetratricopeptide repeat protein [Flavobacteriales bacterium]|nr:tetratricopeptide repeat protein [Flavobacteriales bacterium]